jgi:penicillin-insensitive murein endopeptidase
MNSSRSSRPLALGTCALLALLLTAPPTCLSKEKPKKSPANFSLTTLLRTWAPAAPSVSSGMASQGSLANCATFPPRAPGLHLSDEALRRGTANATEPLVNLVLRVALQTALDHPPSFLKVGNASLKEGGRIPQSRSHQAGRDVDLFFFYTDRKEQPLALAPGMLACDDEGRCEGGHRFDAVRNWTVVKGLLQSKDPVVQWIFVAPGLRELLLQEAEGHPEDKALLALAREVLHRPTDSRSHDDHFHVRIYCSAEDLAGGCIDFGPTRANAPDNALAMKRLHNESLSNLSGGNAEERKAALASLKRTEDWLPLVVGVLGEASSNEVRGELLEALKWNRGEELIDICRQLLAEPKLPLDTRKKALSCLVLSAEPKDFQVFLSLAEQRDRKLAEAGRWALQQFTGRSSAPCGGRKTKDEGRCWREWWKENKDRSYKHWVEQALERQGYRPTADKEATRNASLLKAMAAGNPASFMAQWYLAKLHDEPLLYVLPPRKAQAYWKERLAK